MAGGVYPTGDDRRLETPRATPGAGSGGSSFGAATYEVQIQDTFVILDCASTSVEVLLPLASNSQDRLIMFFARNVNPNIVLFTPNVGDAAPLVTGSMQFPDGDKIHFVECNGVNWRVRCPVTREDFFNIMSIGDLSDVDGVTGSGSEIVFSLAPTLVVPIIESFFNAMHDHGDADGGGTLDLYAFLAGKAGGQTLQGGTGAGELLTLRGSAAGLAFASKGFICFNDSVFLLDLANDPFTAGVLLRNGANLKWHDGTAARTLLHDASVLPIGNAFITNAMLRNSAALSVMGRASSVPGGGGVPADIVAGDGSGHVLRESSSVLAFGTIGAAVIASGTMATARLGSGSANSTTFLRGDQTYAQVDPAAALVTGTPGYSLESGVLAPAWTARGIRYRRELQYFTDLGLTTGTLVGLKTVPVISGTVSNQDSATRPTIRCVTGATSGNSAGVLSGFDVTRVGWLGEGNFIISVGNTITTYRFWCGFTSADLTGIATPTTQHVAAFSYDTARDGTVFFRTITGNGTAATVTATSVAFAAGQAYHLRIVFVSSTQIEFYIDNVLVSTHTTNTPGTTTNLGFQMAATTLTAATRRMDWSRVGIMSL